MQWSMQGRKCKGPRPPLNREGAGVSFGIRARVKGVWAEEGPGRRKNVCISSQSQNVAPSRN